MTPESRMAPRPRLLLVHGSVSNADTTFAAQEPLRERFEVHAPNRPGFPPGPEIERVDFDADAAWLEGLLAGGAC